MKARLEREADVGREAAYNESVDEELCRDLTGKFARESAARRTGDTIGAIRDRYEAIALGFRCARAAQSSEAPLTLGNALNALAEEFERDRKGLLRFLDAVFKRWRKIDQPDSLWRQQLLTHQHLGGPKVVAKFLENAGAVSKTTTPQQFDALCQRIKQYRSRDRKAALKRQKER
jgi:hypothetical protein